MIVACAHDATGLCYGCAKRLEARNREFRQRLRRRAKLEAAAVTAERYGLRRIARELRKAVNGGVR